MDASGLVSIYLTPADDFENPPQPFEDEEMDCDSSSTTPRDLDQRFTFTYQRMHSPVSDLATRLEVGLHTTTPTPSPGPEEKETGNPKRGFGFVHDDKENRRNDIIMTSPSPCSPSKKTISNLELLADEEEESEVASLFSSDSEFICRPNSDPIVANKLNQSMPEMPVLQSICNTECDGQLRRVRKLKQTRARANTGGSPGQRKRKSVERQRITKTRPSSPAMSPSISRYASNDEKISSCPVPPRRIAALIPSLPNSSDEPPVERHIDLRRRASITKSPHSSPRSSLRVSSETLLQASPKRSSWTKSSLLKSEGSLPLTPRFRCPPPVPAESLPPRPLSARGYMRTSGGPNPTPWIKFQLGSLQSEFAKDFSEGLTNASATQSDGELEEEEELFSRSNEAGREPTLRRSVSEMDINAVANAQQRKRKYSHKSAELFIHTASFQMHCEQVRAEQACKVPTIMSSKHPDLDVIEVKTLLRMLKGDFREQFSEVYVIDCRFPYEFEGGHVVGAVNLHTQHLLEERFPVLRCDEDDNIKKPAIVFHCEFSSERGPKQYRHLRKIDREINYDFYPRLFYPHLFLLSGGYKEFFLATEGEMCEPKAYVEMRDARFTDDLARHTAERKSKPCLKKFRSQSYSNLLGYMGK